MWSIFKNVWLGVALIVAVSALLLYSDLESRKDAQDNEHKERVMRVAILQHASQAVLDDGREGAIAGLRDQGWVEGQNLKIDVFNAQGDMPTAHNMATAIVGGKYDLMISISTLSLQALANANQRGKTPHIFGLVTDPAAAGVGISATDPMDHPAHMAGYGTMQPVRRSFEIAREIDPNMKTVGIVWNVSEANSEKQLEMAREIAKEMGITLKEANAENSMGVGEATAALAARGVDAIWAPGDVTIIVAMDALVSAARSNNIPVFTVIPPNVDRGAVFDVGADYWTVGYKVGELAGQVLDGLDPATVPIVNYMPEVIMLNEQAAAKSKGNWQFPPKLVADAKVIIDKDGKRTERASNKPMNLKPEPGRIYKLGVAYFAPEESWQRCYNGLFDGLKELGFEPGKNLEVTAQHAGAEMINIRPILQNLDNSDVDVIVTFTTPVLQGATTAVDKHPVVFTYVTDPIAAGAAKTLTDHHPNITGIGSMPPLADTLRLAELLLPNVKKYGTIYNAGEANSVKEVTIFEQLLKERGGELIKLTAGNSNEVIQTVQALVGRDIDAVYLPSDNTVYQAFEPVAEIINEAGLPLINGDASVQGPILSVGPGYYYSGKAAAKPLAQVLLGANPGTIPMENVSVNNIAFNEDIARQLKLPVSDAFRAALKAEEEKLAAKNNPAPRKAKANPNPSGKKWKITIFSYVESPPFEEAYEGILQALKESPLKEGKDYEISFYSAQGDMGALNSIVDAALTDRADMIVALSTPGLQTAIRKTDKTPIVFGVVSDPIVAGAGKSNTDHQPNVAGIAVGLPAEEMLDILQKYFPQYKTIGTLFCPNEANSENSKRLFEAACKARGIKLEAVAVNSSGDLADAALALMSRSQLDAVVQIPDNLSSAGFGAIANAAQKTQTPLLSMNSVTVAMGAAYAMGRDYYEAGHETGVVMLQIIGGENPADIPFRVSPHIISKASEANAEKLGMKLPPALLDTIQPSAH